MRNRTSASMSVLCIYNREHEKCSTAVEGNLLPKHIRLPSIFDRQLALRFSFYPGIISSIRCCPTTLNRVSSLGLVFSTAPRLILLMALKPRLMNSLHLLPLVELIRARLPRPRALCITTVSSSSRRANTFSRPPRLLIFIFSCYSSLDT